MTMSKKRKIIAITSFPTVGNAGLKHMMSILGTHLIPVPTVLLSGLGFIQGNERFETPLKALLNETFLMAENKEYELILYIGYLRDASQVSIVLDAIAQFEHLIETIIVDPICGDNGKAYVKMELIEELPRLLAKANWALPNETEVRILSGFDFESPIEELEQNFLEKYQDLHLITTGVKVTEEVQNHFLFNTDKFITRHKWVNKPISGTGDAFAALFIFFFFIKGEIASTALLMSGETLSRWIQRSHDLGGNELTLDPATLSDIATIVTLDIND